jgi:hypothetical protein
VWTPCEVEGVAEASAGFVAGGEPGSLADLVADGLSRPSEVPVYLELLAKGGSASPEDLGRIVGVDLADPAFWDGGLDIIQEQLEKAEQAATDAGR